METTKKTNTVTCPYLLSYTVTGAGRGVRALPR